MQKPGKMPAKFASSDWPGALAASSQLPRASRHSLDEAHHNISKLCLLIPVSSILFLLHLSHPNFIQFHPGNRQEDIESIENILKNSKLRQINLRHRELFQAESPDSQ
jgi:hypothetical protein